jgi:hypothetical protein
MKRKVINCNANINFNKQCLARNLIPKYARIKISGHSLPATHTKNKAEEIRVKNEIKFLYLKKQQLNRELYTLQLLNAHTWDKSWELIHNEINIKLNKEMANKYKNMNNKIKTLEHSFDICNKMCCV